MEVVTITDVETPGAPNGLVQDFRLTSPTAGKGSDVYAITFEGWVMAEQSRPLRLEITRIGIPVGEVPVGMFRPDLQQVFPKIPWAVESGFEASIGVLRLPSDFKLDVTVVLEDGTHAPIATVSGRWRPPRTDESGLRPLLVTTLGRSGSNWVMKLLSSHPEVVAYRPSQGEVRVASYWAEVLLTASEPASYGQSVHAMILDDDWWLGQPYPGDSWRTDDEVSWLLGHDQVEDLTRFCRSRIETFYHVVARREGKQPRYFVEKRVPHPRSQIFAIAGMFPGTREIVLVRDFRDMLCSILSYNEKHGRPFFGREGLPSDEDYVREQLVHGVNEISSAWRERSESALLVRYEDLVEWPRETLRPLLAYLDLEEDEESIELMLSRGSNKDSALQRRHVTTDSAEDSVGRWRHDLSPSLQKACAEAFGDALQTFGYEV